MNFLGLFRMPTPMKITGRSSSITNAFINSIIPVIYPTESEVKQALEILELDPGDLRCAYCGSIATEWDHLRPLVKDKNPTGYISEINNLVPSCGKCNQSQGNKDWRAWMESNARLSPKTMGVPDLSRRVKRLEIYESSFIPIRIDIKELIGEALWEKHWENWESIIKQMQEAQILANTINNLIKISYMKAKRMDSSGRVDTLGS
jgi:hypothetical protein